MTRRITLRILGVIVFFAASPLLILFNQPFRDKVKGHLRHKFFPPKERIPYEERKEAGLPPEGEQISVELALNSRCSSDH